jgi:RNA polymerase sigma factor (sigma-70 family)
LVRKDAEDAVQETMMAAWQGIGGFTAASRRPVREWDMSRFEAPVPTPRDEAAWLQPFPDAFLEGAVDRPLGPEARYEQSEAISLAFVAALQVLPPRQVAVLILRDVLGFHASEVAEMLEVTVQSVNSTLKRARASKAAAGTRADGRAGRGVSDAGIA